MKSSKQTPVLVVLSIIVGLGLSFSSYGQQGCQQSQPSASPVNVQNCNACAFPELSDIESLNFKISLDAMKKGGYQFSVGIKKGKDMVSDHPELASIDFENFMDKKAGNHVWSTKNAYVLDVEPSFFSDEMLNSTAFNEATNKDTTWATTDEPNKLTYTATNITYAGKSRPDVTADVRTYTYDLKSGRGNLDLGKVQAIVALNPELKATPEKIAYSVTFNSSDKSQVGSTTVTMYYRTKDNKTLLVSYWTLALSLSFLESMGLSAAAPFIKSYASPGTQKNVIMAREAVKRFSQK